MTAPAHLRRAQCDSCSEPIYWVYTDERERMPIDVEPVEHGNLLLSPANVPPSVTVVSKAGRPPGTKLYVSHFATCRHADQHRKRPPVQPRPVAPKATPQAALFSEPRR